MKTRMVRLIFVTAGAVFLLLGLIGIFVPVLPTTPFLLLTAFCWVRGSEKLHAWLLNHRTFGPFIKDFLEKKALKQGTKIKAVSLIWASLCLSMFLVQKTHISLILITVGTALTIYLLSLKTLSEPPAE